MRRGLRRGPGGWLSRVVRRWFRRGRVGRAGSGVRRPGGWRHPVEWQGRPSWRRRQSTMNCASSQIGLCAGCQRQTWRYGPGGLPLCTWCMDVQQARWVGGRLSDSRKLARRVPPAYGQAVSFRSKFSYSAFSHIFTVTLAFCESIFTLFKVASAMWPWDVLRHTLRPTATVTSLSPVVSTRSEHSREVGASPAGTTT